jgi:hypothetical protein
MPLNNKTILLYDVNDVVNECAKDLNLDACLVDCILDAMVSGDKLVNGVAKSFYEGTFDELISDVKAFEDDSFYSPVMEYLSDLYDDWSDMPIDDKISVIYSIKQWMRKNELLDMNVDPKVMIRFGD